MPPAKSLFPPLRAALLVAASLGFGGCGGKEQGPFPFEAGRERDEPLRKVPAGPTTLRRLTFPSRKPTLTWTVPPGWEEQPPDGGSMRIASFRVPGKDDAERGDVSVVKAGGTVEANVNRWAKQMGLKDLPPEKLGTLPRGTMLGEPSVIVDFAGAYAGMGGGETQPGWRLLAHMQLGASERLAVKFTGPAALVEAQRAAFESFVASLAMESGEGDEYEPGNDAKAPPAPPQPPAPRSAGLDPSRLRWDLPKGWTDSAGTGMFRVREFQVEGAPGLEIVLSLLSGDVGGLKANVNRWRTQLGASELDDKAIAALERFEVLGTPSVWIEIEGKYQGMGAAAVPGALYVGVICLRPDAAVFLRLVGPKADVEPRREAFRALCQSLRLEG